MTRIEWALFSAMACVGCRGGFTMATMGGALQRSTLDVNSDKHVRYAGSNGWVGQTQDAGVRWTEKQWMAPDGTTPSFRASAFAGEHWFAAGIASPAWIARVSATAMDAEWVPRHQHRSLLRCHGVVEWTRGVGLWRPHRRLFDLAGDSRWRSNLESHSLQRRIRPWKARLDSRPPTATFALKETPRGCSLESQFPMLQKHRCRTRGP